MKKLFFSILMCLMASSMSAQKCAVLEFRGAVSVSVADIDGISEMFMTYFRPAGYTMIERAQIDKVISEQHYQRTNITDNQAVQLGKILNASVVVVGKVSMLGGKYQVDVRAVNVQSGLDIAGEGATFSGDFRTNVQNLANQLASKIAIGMWEKVQQTVPAPSAQPSQPVVPQPKKRNGVEIIYGYLKVFPNELGTFDSEPSSVIAQINKQVLHGYNNWRIPTNEELSLLRANNYLGEDQYMTKERRNGIVLLISDGEDYATIQEKVRKTEEARKAEEVRKAEEEERRIRLQQGWIDLGLPSGTLWNSRNEEGGVYSYDQAVARFGDNLPSKSQFEELKDKCTWEWIGDGYIVKGKNGNSIFLPAAGYRYCSGEVCCIGWIAHYWSSTPAGSLAYFLNCDSTRVRVSGNIDLCCGLSVRLVR